MDEVINQIERIVTSVIRHETEQGLGFFEDIRRRRMCGRYAQVWNFADQILGTDKTLHCTPLPTVGSTNQPAKQNCGNDDALPWKYVPDDTPLPDFVVERIRVAFRQAKRQIRKNKAGRYSALDAITRFINYLLAGRKPGERRASRKLLEQMGFPTQGNDREKIIRLLIKAGLLAKGDYASRTRSRKWILTDVSQYTVTL